MERTLRRSSMMMNLKKTYLKEKAYLKQQTKLQTLTNLKNSKKVLLTTLIRKKEKRQKS